MAEQPHVCYVCTSFRLKERLNIPRLLEYRLRRRQQGATVGVQHEPPAHPVEHGHTEGGLKFSQCGARRRLRTRVLRSRRMSGARACQGDKDTQLPKRKSRDALHKPRE